MEIAVGILFLTTPVFYAKYWSNKKWQNIMLFLLGFLLCYRINKNITESDLYLVRYTADYWQVSILDTIIIYFGFVAIFNLNYIKKFTNHDLIILLIFLGLHIISYFQSINKIATLMAIIRLIKLIFLYLYFSRVFSINNQSKYLVNGLSIGVITQAIIVILQKMNNGPIGLNLFGEQTFGFRTREVGGSISTGMAGTFEHSADLSIYALFIICIFIFSISEIGIFKYYSALFSAIIIIYMAESRTVLLLTGFVVVIFLINNVKNKIKIRVLFMVMLIIISFLISVISFGSHIREIFIDSDIGNMITVRLDQWGVGLSYIYIKPLIGYGANNFTDYMYYKANNLYNIYFNYQNPIHNTYLQYWFDLGLIGMITVVFIQFRNISLIIMQTKQKINIDPIRKGALAFAIVSIVYYMTGWAFLKEPMIYMLWICYGIVFNSTELNLVTSIKKSVV